MEITVVIPAYNRRHTLGRAIDSVLRQTRSASEIIVVNDGSTDRTGQYLELNYPQVRCIGITENKGVSHARNTGIDAVETEWIAFLDSDDEWVPNKLKCQVALLSGNSGYRICHSDEIWIRNGKRVNPMLKHAKHGGDIFLNCLPRCVISPSSVILHRQVFEDVGMFNEDLPACEDYDLWLRICSKYDVLYVNEKLTLKYGGHEDQLSRKHWGMDRFRVQALENILNTSSLGEQYKIEVLRMLIEKLNILKQGALKRQNKEMESDCAKKLSTYTEKLNTILVSNQMQFTEQAK